MKTRNELIIKMKNLKKKKSTKKKKNAKKVKKKVRFLFLLYLLEMSIREVENNCIVN